MLLGASNITHASCLSYGTKSLKKQKQVIFSSQDDSRCGSLPARVLGRLNKLAVLRFNALSVPLASDLATCVELRVVNLQSNLLSYELPAAVLTLQVLTLFTLTDNRFSGLIPLPLP